MINREERLRMWRESFEGNPLGQRQRYTDAIEREARKQERERCAQVCDSRYMGDNNREDAEARRCAEAIRALDDE